MVDHSLSDIAIRSLIDIGVLLICNWLLFFALQKLRTCGYINRWILLVFSALYTPILCAMWVVGLFSIY